MELNYNGYKKELVERIIETERYVDLYKKNGKFITIKFKKTPATTTFATWHKICMESAVGIENYLSLTRRGLLCYTFDLPLE